MGYDGAFWVKGFGFRVVEFAVLGFSVLGCLGL